MVGGQSVYLQHEGSMIGVQYQFVIFRVDVKLLKGIFQFFIAIGGSILKLISNSDF